METIQYATKTKALKDHKCDFCLEAISKGEIYLKSIHKVDTIYTWKTHIECQAIASKLKMYDYADEGVSTDNFIESIKNEYQHIMSETQNELFESKDFTIPPFKDQLIFVISHHN